MSGKGAAAGKSFLAGVLAKLSPEDRQKGEEAWKTLEGLGGGTVVAAVGDGTLAQDEFSRQSDALKTQAEALEAQKQDLDQRDQSLQAWHVELNDWYGKVKGRLAAGKPSGNGNGDPDPKPGDKPVPSAVALTEEAYTEKIGQERAAFLGFSRDQNLITREHYQKFGEIVDLEPLLRHQQIGQVGLLGVYELVHKDRLEKHKADAQAAHDKKIADAAVQQFRESQATMPYPTPTGAGSGSPLDALTVGVKSPLVDAATAEYTRLQAERAAGRPAV